MKRRLEKLRAFMERFALDAILVTKVENQRYFSGFSGTSGALVVTREEAVLLTDFRYVEQATRQAPCYTVVEHGRSIMEKIGEVIVASGAAEIGFEGDALTYNEFSMLKQQLSIQAIKSVGLDQLRAIKDQDEVRKTQRAVEISDKAFAHILSVLRPGVTELMIAAELEHVMRSLGSERPAFETIVASGKRGSLPHGLATGKAIEAGDFVTMDFGAVYEGYHSDITRTVCVGKASEKQRRIYDIVLKAQLRGIASIRPGISGKAVDEVARRSIMDAGYGKYFGHGLGHGVGLVIHELPRLSPSSTCDCLEENMLVTVEPGIYLPDWGGVRIEDTVLIAAQDARILTQSNKQLMEIE